MGTTTEIARAKARRLKGKIKECDGIALGDEALKSEGRAEQAAALEQQARAKERRRDSRR
ncbi:hypothetical protein [Streptomyces sp. NPDC102437]|uniref:hypothetical protein n=1 Tax=Streptomyces sp. NPDC102437 TaxID=3366175 RepID=UPI003813B551